MLKASLLAAAAFAVFTVAGSAGSHAQNESRQIVVDPVDVGKGPGTGGGGGLGTGGGGGLGSGGGKKKDPVVVVRPGSDGEADVAKGDGGGLEKTVDTQGPALDEPDPLDAIVGLDPADVPGKAAKEETPAVDKAPVATAAPTPTFDSPDELILLLKSKGYRVDIARHEKGGDYVLVVQNQKEKVSGYLLVVDGKHGKIIAKQQINLAEYGYGQGEDYGRTKESYGQKKKPYDDDYETDDGYDDNSDYGNDGGGSGSDY